MKCMTNSVYDDKVLRQTRLDKLITQTYRLHSRQQQKRFLKASLWNCRSNLHPYQSPLPCIMCVPKVFMEYRCFFFIIKSGLQWITSGSASCLRKGRPYCPPSLTVQDTIRNNDKLKQACLCVEIMQKKLKGNIKKRLEGLEY